MATTYLSRTSGTPTNSKKNTLSVWLKRGGLGTGTFFGGGADSSSMTFINFNPNGKIFLQSSASNSNTLVFITTQVFKDTSAWYHIVVAIDTTQATASNRVKLYVNGVQVTAFDTETYPSQNLELEWNKSGKTLEIGKYLFSSSYSIYDGLMSHFNFIDGTQELPTVFGSVDSTSGIWKINTSPSVTYGNNGFFVLKDGITITDSSPNSNNFSLGGGTLTKTEDCPSNNFATLNPLLDVNAVPTFSNGNTTIVGSSSGGARLSGSSISVGTGKWYYEIKTTVHGSQPYIGVIDAQSNIRRNSSYFVAATSGSNDSGYAVNMSGDIYYNNSSTYASNIGSISTGDILGFAVDLTTAQKTCTIYKNGTSMRTFNLANPSSNNYMLGVCSISNSTSAKCEVNFGNGKFGTTAVATNSGNGYAGAEGKSIFNYQPPTNYSALSTKGLNL